jgi:two-component system cell cycle response regulator DivK
VICAENGRLGIELASQQSFDLILLDMQLPIMDGYSVARELRLDRDLKTIPIVAATSYAMAGDRERILAAGCDGYLEKPINPDTFVTEIERFLPPGQKGDQYDPSPDRR